jgi:O-antigen ligase
MLIKSAYYQMALGFIFFIDTLFSPIEYDMVFSYLVLVPLTILLYKIYNKFNLFDTFLIVLGLFMIIVVGARGPIISLVLFWIVLILINSFKNKISLKRIMVFLIALIIVVLCIFYYEFIILEIDSLLQHFGIYSRTITILLTDNIDFSSGRIPIYRYTIKKIMDKPIFGYGIAGDRIFLDGTYPHNIFLEIFVHFGVIMGSIIILIFMFYWFNGIIRNKNKEELDLAIIFFGIGLVNLFISGSYITSSNFWLFMAICINSVHGNKTQCKD